MGQILYLALPPIAAACVAYVAVAAMRGLASRIGLLDRPGHRKVHAVPTPLGGGVGIWFAVVLVFLVGSLLAWFLPQQASWIPEHFVRHRAGMLERASELWVLLAGGSVLMILGLLDDKRGLPWYWRLGVEFVVATAIVYWQGLELTAFIDSPWIPGVLSVLWIVALVNSFNMLDNMDGLSGGVAAIACVVLGLMLVIRPNSSPQVSQLYVATMFFVLAGALIGFLIHNWPPAKIFMGDAGSYFIGYWVAVSTLLATYTDYHGSAAHAVLAPLFALAIPLYDMTSVIWIRLRSGRSPFQADKKHFSHRLVELGFSKPSAVFTIYLATLTCGLAAMLLPRTDLIGGVFLLTIVCCMLGLIAILENRAWHDDVPS